MFKKLLLLIPMLFSLCSCSIQEIQSFFDYINGNTTLDDSSNNSTTDSQNKDSINLLKEAFNGFYDINGDALKDSYHISYLPENQGVTYNTITNNVQDLKYYDGKTPSKGDVRGLVIPIDFVDAPALTDVTGISKRVKDHSVSSYYYNSSYGKLNMTFDVLDWQRMSKKSSYYANLKSGYEGEVPGVSAIIHELFKKLNNKIDFSKYDNDGDSIIDCLYIIYSKDIDYKYGKFWWAYNYYYLEDHLFDKVFPYSYVFAGYDFLFEEGYKGGLSTKTYIHETGHLFGLNDYYDYDTTKGYNKGGLGGADMMDYNVGDHNPFSKLSVGWIDVVQLVTLDDLKSLTLNLRPYSIFGDVLMICDNYNDKLGIFQDYFLVIYHDYPNTLTTKNDVHKKNGIKVYRVHGVLTPHTSSNGENYVDFKYDNSYTDYNLIDSIIANSKTKQVASNYGLYSKLTYNKQLASDNDMFYKDYTCNTLAYYENNSNGTASLSSYSFYVNDIIDSYATITVTKH